MHDHAHVAGLQAQRRQGAGENNLGMFLKHLDLS
jgi:hypothetical protein